ncbi:MAG: methyltransferase domain-containing protein [Hyphomicrobiaceae bacterium]
MRNRLGMALDLGANVLRVGWYFGVNRIVERQTSRLGAARNFVPTRPVPSQRELFRDLAELMRADAEAVGAGRYPPTEIGPTPPLSHLGRVRAMLRDLPSALERRAASDAGSARQLADHGELPDYFTQDFHFQTGGYLTEDSARLYDVQVETLFYGSASLMRRAALGPILDAVDGRDQRTLALADIACGTGRLLREIRRALPAIRLTGVDLSAAYLDEAARHMGTLRQADWRAGNAEAIPLEDASQDIVVSVFLFHELPPQVRRTVASEFARILKPGGRLVFVDSLQMGDRPGWDGMLEAFPVRFHEPYYRHYAIDDLDAVFADAGLDAVETRLAFLSKIMVRRNAG